MKFINRRERKHSQWRKKNVKENNFSYCSQGAVSLAQRAFADEMLIFEQMRTDTQKKRGELLWIRKYSIFSSILVKRNESTLCIVYNWMRKKKEINIPNKSDFLFNKI